jgi:L-malate glycosyltransferase
MTSPADARPRARERAHQPLPILFLIPALDRGGAEGQLIALINGLDRQRFLPILCCLEAVSPDPKREVGCEVRSIGMRSLFRPSAILGLLRIAALIRRHHVGVVHACFLRAEVIGVLARLGGRRVGVILGKRDLGHYKYGLRERLLVRLAHGGADLIVANAAAVKDRLESTWHVPREKSMVIYNGVDLERFAPASRERRAEVKRQLGISPDEYLVTIVTHLVPVKGVDVFVDAAALTAQEASDVRFVVVGGGDLESALKKRACSLRIERGILFAGAVDDVLPYLEAADVGVLSSVSEGFPNAILEYMAMGLPVVATDVGGVGELMGKDADCGFLVEAGQPQMLAGRLLTLIRDPELRARMGHCARLRAERLFDLRQMVIAYERLYDHFSLLEGRA